MTLALLTIGTELTRGELVNSNSTWLAERLASLGHEVTEMVTVDDDETRIVSTLRRLCSEHDAVLSTGGLGPTTDDLTTACAARLLGVPLERDAASLRSIASLFERRGRTMAPSNAKQADFPRGACIMPNARGTAPGFFIDVPRTSDASACRAFFMPGVPTEMKAMFEEHARSALPPVTAAVHTVRLRTFGMPESEVNDRLAGLESTHGFTLGYRASNSEIEVKILATAKAGESPTDLRQRAEAIADIVAERLGAVVYARGEARLPQVVGELLLERGGKLSLAESCTGGLVAQMITQVPGASRYFQGGVVSYSNSSKEELLGVDPIALEEHGAVSEEVAVQMAKGARRRFGAEYALALTGIAGPGGGTQDKPVGLVHWALAHPDGVLSEHHVFFGTRDQIQRRAALSGLWSLWTLLSGSTHGRTRTARR